jgi:hypothetical protein
VDVAKMVQRASWIGRAANGCFGPNASNVRATAAFGTEEDMNQNIRVVSNLIHPVQVFSGDPARSVDRATGRQRIGQVGDLVVALAREAADLFDRLIVCGFAFSIAACS